MKFQYFKKHVNTEDKKWSINIWRSIYIVWKRRRI